MNKEKIPMWKYVFVFILLWFLAMWDIELCILAYKIHIVASIILGGFAVTLYVFIVIYSYDLMKEARK